MIGAKHLVHDIRVDESETRMAKRFWKRADDVEPHLLPQAHGAFVARHHEVVLHRSVATRCRLGLRVLTHPGGDTFSSRLLGDDVAAVADMRTRALSVRFHVVSA